MGMAAGTAQNIENYGSPNNPQLVGGPVDQPIYGPGGPDGQLPPTMGGKGGGIMNMLGGGQPQLVGGPVNQPIIGQPPMPSQVLGQTGQPSPFLNQIPGQMGSQPQLVGGPVGQPYYGAPPAPGTGGMGVPQVQGFPTGTPVNQAVGQPQLQGGMRYRQPLQNRYMPWRYRR